MQSKRMKKLAVSAIAVAALTTLGIGGVATTAEADVAVGSDTSWEIPTQSMTNVLQLDGKYYKVITTQTASNWVTAGPDWVGVSNSAQLSTTDRGATASQVATDTMTGIWASSANQVPNAYNWNYFYNLYADANGLNTVNLEIVNDGTALDAETGAPTGLKYRPEICWTDAIADEAGFNNRTGEPQYTKGYADYIQFIREGRYFTELPTYDGTDGTMTDPGTEVADPSKYALPYDSEYNPYDIGMSNGDNNNNPLSVSYLLYKMAWACEETIAATANYDGMYNGEAVTDQYTDDSWKAMNTLPRTTRYEASTENPMSARDCALAFERLQKAAGWYILSQIDEGKVAKKKVAFISDDPDPDSNIACVNAFDAYDAFSAASSANGLSSNAGFAGVSGPYFDQLVAGSYDVVEGDFGGNTIMCEVTCDDLASCDVIIITGSGGTNGTTDYTTDTLKEWMVNHCTTQKNKDLASQIQYDCFAPTQCNSKNFSVDKSIYGLGCLDFVYPECFPNMELLTYWYNCIYHIKAANLKEVMQWTLANTSLPDETSLSAISDSYSIDDMECKAAYGYEYFKNNGSKDEVISTLMANKGVVTGNDLGTYDKLDANGNTIEGQTDTWANIYYAPTSSFEDWATDYVKTDTYKKFTGQSTTSGNGGNGGKAKSSTAKKQTIKAKKSVKAKKGKKAKITVKGAKTALKVTAKGKAKKALKLKVKKGKITVKAKKKGTFKIKVYAKKSGNYAKSNTLTIKVKVK